jgi:hypothetical protein
MNNTEFEQDPLAWLKSLSESMRKITIEAITNLTKKEPEQQIVIPVPPSTVKRRGRPPKATSNNASADKEKTPIREKENFKIPGPLDTNKISELPPPSTAKRRGRPPKTPKNENIAKPEPEDKIITPIKEKKTEAKGFKIPDVGKKVPFEELEKKEPLPPPPSTMKKRGRPKKIIETLPIQPVEESKPDSVANNILPKPEILSAQPLTVVPPSTIKRKRGRPSLASKKTRLSESESVIDEPNIAKTPTSGSTNGFKPILPMPIPAQSAETWVTVSKETHTIAPSVLATPKPTNSFSTQNTENKPPSPQIQKVESWTSKFLKPAPPPPSTVKRSARIAAKFKPQSQILLEESVAIDSPLTRAKKIDLEFSKREAEIKSLIESGSEILKQKISSLSIESVAPKEPKDFNKDLIDESPIRPKNQPSVGISVKEIMQETPLNIEFSGDEDELFSRKIEEKFAADTLSKLTDLASSQNSPEPISIAGTTTKLNEHSLNRIRERQEKAVEKKRQQIEKAQLAKVQQQPLPKPPLPVKPPPALFTKPSTGPTITGNSTLPSAIKKPVPIESVIFA